MFGQILATLSDFLDPEYLIEHGGPALLFLIVFAESGLLIGFFLPGDSLLFTAGAIAGGAFIEKLPDVHLNLWVLCIGCFIAAVVGDQVGYLIGKTVGPKLFNRPDSRLFKQEYVEKSQHFFEKNGPKAIVLARFVPIVRTFVPTIAGVSSMPYATFVRYNIIGGLIWGVGVVLLGHQFGQIEWVQNNFEIAILAVVAISLLPMVAEVIAHRRAKKRAASQ